MVATLVFGPRLVKIRGNYDDVNRLCTEIADEYGWAIVNVNLRPYYTEGAKTHGFEIAEQLGWRLPKHTVSPSPAGRSCPRSGRRIVSSSTSAWSRTTARASTRRRRRAAIRSPARSSPGPTRSSRRSPTPSPRASRSAIPRTARTRSAWSATRAASRRRRPIREILDAVERLARSEGIFTEPAGGTTLACAIKLIESGRIPKDESVCVSITGQRAEDDRGAAGPPGRRCR